MIFFAAAAASNPFTSVNIFDGHEHGGIIGTNFSFRIRNGSNISIVKMEPVPFQENSQSVLAKQQGLWKSLNNRGLSLRSESR